MRETIEKAEDTVRKGERDVDRRKQHERAIFQMEYPREYCYGKNLDHYYRNNKYSTVFGDLSCGRTTGFQPDLISLELGSSSSSSGGLIFLKNKKSKMAAIP